MNSFIKTIQTELIKKRHTGIFTLSFILGVFIPLLFFIVSFFFDEEKGEVKIPINIYFETLKSSLIPFLGFFLPVLIIIITSKITQIDHKNRGWSFMETQPITKFSIYFSKYLLLLMATLIAIITFLFFTFLFVWIRTLINDLPSYYIIEFGLMNYIKIGLRIFVITLCITAFQYMLSVRIKSFIWPILIGFLTMLLPQMLMMYKDSLFWYPFNMLNQIADYPKGSDVGFFFTYTQVLSVLYTFVFLFIGYNWYRYKSLINAFYHPKIKLIKLLAFLILFGLLITFTLKPKHQKFYSKTVISGHVESDKEIENITVLEATTRDTIAKLNLINNRFHHIINKKIPTKYYIFKIDNYNEYSLYFGDKDSINIMYKLFGKKQSFNISGTRIPENRKVKRLFYWDRIEYALKNNSNIDNADYYMKEIYNQWKKELNKLKSNRTIDNFIPKDDYLSIAKKQVNLKYIKHWNKFKKLRQLLFPNKTYNVTFKIKELENSLSLSNESMLVYDDYFSFIKDEILKNDHREINEDQKLFDAIVKLEKGAFRDKLLFKHLNKSLKEETSVKSRDSLFFKYVDLVSKQSYKDLLLKHRTKYNDLSKNILAPNFVAYNKNGKEFHLSDFTGKFVIIDVWASWCGPCIAESPYYEKKALKYKKENIVFVSLSADRKKKDWLLAIQDKSSTILQLHLKDIEQFHKDYKVETIPRFIFINPDGKFIDSNFERPSSKNFNTLLEISLN